MSLRFTGIDAQNELNICYLIFLTVMKRISGAQLNFVMRGLVKWYPELMAVIQGSDTLLKFLHVEKTLGIPSGNLINMCIEHFVEFGRLHDNENIRKHFTEEITDDFWSI